MLLQTIGFSVSGDAVVEDGVKVRSLPYAHVIIGWPHWAMGDQKKYRRIPLGMQFAEKIGNRVPCQKDGDGYQLGRCVHCGKDITEKNREKISQKRSMPSGEVIEVFDWKAAHSTIWEYETPVTRASFIRTKDKNTLMCVEERENDKDGRIALFLHAEEGYRGTSTIKLITKDAGELIEKIHEEFQGERWNGKAAKPKDAKSINTSGLGRGAECLAILKAGDQVQVTRTGKLMGNPAVLIFEIQTDLTIKRLSAEGKTAEDSRPKNAIEI